MVKTTIKPDTQDISIHIPESYIGKQIEVLLYAVDELNEQENPNKKKLSDFKGALKMTDEQYTDFQTHLKNIRDEWERDI